LAQEFPAMAKPSAAMPPGAPLPRRTHGRGLRLAWLSALLGAAVAGLSAPFSWAWAAGSSLRSGAEQRDRASAPTARAASSPSSSDHLPALGRRSAASAALLAALGAAPAARGYEGVRNTPDPFSPDPSDNPFIRKLQAKTWAMQSSIRQRAWLKAMMKQRQDNKFYAPFSIVRWSNNGNDQYKYDILEDGNFKEANTQGKVLAEQEMSDPLNDLVVYVYVNDEARDYTQKTVGVYDTIECPDDLIEAIAEVKKNPFKG